MERIIDSHLHFNLDSDDPVLDLYDRMSENNYEKAVLILNQDKEIKLFETRHNLIKELFGNRLFIAGIINPSILEEDKTHDRWKSWGFRVGTKLHPRISKLTKDSFEYLNDIIQDDFVIIDCFSYGHQIEYHIGIELGIYLAERHPENNYILAHAGGIRALECMLWTRTLQNIYYDFSLSCSYLQGTSVWLDLVHFLKYSSSKIMFGSDYPQFCLKDAVRTMQTLCEEADLSKSEIESVFYQNAEKLFWN